MKKNIVAGTIVTETDADNADRKLAENVLQAGIEKYRNDSTLYHLIMESPVEIVLFALDRNYCYTAFTETHTEIIKKIWGVDVCSGMNMLDIISNPEDRQKARENFDRAMRGECFSRIEEFGDRELYQAVYENFYRPLKDACDKVVGVSVFVVNITQRKLHEEAIKDREDQFQNLFVNAPVGIFHSDLEGKLMAANPAMAKMLGYAGTEELIVAVTDMSTQIYDDPELRPQIMAALMKQEGWIHFGEISWRRKDQRIITVDMTGRIVQNAIGTIALLEGFVEDITERKKTEYELRISEEKFRNLFNNAEVGMFRTRLDGSEILEFNAKYLNILNYTREELYGNPSADLWADKHQRDEMVTLLERDGQVTDFESKMVTRQGEIRRCLTSARLYRDTGILEGSIQDITERKNAEKAFQESSQLTSQIINCVDEGIIVFDPELRYKVWNPFMEKLTRVRAEQVVGKHLTELFPFLEDAGLADKVQRAFSGEYFNDNDFPMPQTDSGRRGWTSYTISPLKGKNGEITGVAVTIHDITERKLAEEKVREKEIQFNKLSSQLPDMIFQFTRRADGSYCIPVASPGIMNIFGCSPEDVREDFSPVVKIIHPEDSAKLFGQIEYSAQHLTPFNCEFRVQIPGREIQWVLSRSIPEKLPDGSMTWYGFSTNITGLKETEQALIKAKEKAEESDKLKSAFLANMSHEIRTPMNGILGFAGLLKEPDLSGEQQQKYIRIIEKSGTRMLNIINNIVDISKIEAGQMEVALSTVNVNAATEYFYNFFKSEADLKGIRLTVHNALSAKEAIIISDSHKFDSILANLLKNAIKYTQSGSIDFGYGVITTGQESSLQFFVKDTGIGIPAGRHQAVFERFIQADIFDKQAYQGAGLGLSIARAYVEMVGGKMRLESEPGKGSVFYFTLPYHTTTKQTGPENSASTGQNLKDEAGKLKILVVEDDEISELFIDTIISQISREVLHAETGAEAIQLCRDNPDTDLVLMDMRLPGISGFNATRQIRQFNKDVIIIAQTAHGLSTDREKTIEAGCNDYISKPIDRQQFMALIRLYFNI